MTTWRVRGSAPLLLVALLAGCDSAGSSSEAGASSSGPRPSASAGSTASATTASATTASATTATPTAPTTGAPTTPAPAPTAPTPTAGPAVGAAAPAAAAPRTWPAEVPYPAEGRVWAVHVGIARDGSPAEQDRLRELAEDLRAAGYAVARGPGSVRCEPGAAEALGLAPDAVALPVLLHSREDVHRFLAMWDRPHVGHVQTTENCIP